MLGFNDNAAIGAAAPDAQTFRVSAAALLLPAIVVALLYGAALGALVLAGQGGGALARLCLAVLGIVVPVLLAQALLRAFTVKVEPMAHALRLCTGFPSTEPVELPWAAIAGASAKRGLGGLIAGGGTLCVQLHSGETLAAAGLKHPGAAARRIQALAERQRRTTAPEVPPQAQKRLSAAAQ